MFGSVKSNAIRRSSNAIRRSEQLKIPRYITTRVNEVYPVKKSSERCRVFNGDQKAKVGKLLNYVFHALILKYFVMGVLLTDVVFILTL